VSPARPQGSPLAGIAVGLGLVAVAVALNLPSRSSDTVARPALTLLVPGVVAAVVGGRRAAIVTAVVAAVCFNVAFLPPYGTLQVHLVDDVVVLVIFTAVAVLVGTLVALEAERRRAAEQRAREIEQLQVELDHLAVLREVDDQRRALLRSVSHDLRTPLATIRAAASELEDDSTHDSATRAELLELVEDEADRLDRLVGNLLSMSRIEAGALQPERQAVPIDELVGDCVQRLGRLFRQVRIHLDIEPDLPYADADYTLLGQVVTNLLENAARHAPQASTVWIGARRTGAMVEVSIRDEGWGITDFERSRIFEAFATGRDSRSSGIGLATCKAIIEAHGGTIDVSAAPGTGAAFVFTVPARPEHPRA
jgi:two-component system sensor histidine kinase KdpD